MSGCAKALRPRYTLSPLAEVPDKLLLNKLHSPHQTGH